MSPTPQEKRTRCQTQEVPTAEPVAKKPRYDTTTTSVSTSASGCIHISKVDPNGRYVEITNMSNEVIIIVSCSTLCVLYVLLSYIDSG